MDRSPNRVAALFRAVVAMLFVAAPAALAQQHAHATLLAKADGDDVKVAIEIALDPGWHIYHGPTVADMGSPDAVGTPTVVTLIGEGFTWSAPRFPKPSKESQEFISPQTFIYEHVGTPVIWLRGTKSAGADVTKLQAKIEGQTCDAGGCLPYGETVAVSGPGTEKLWKKFPADLVIAPPAAGNGDEDLARLPMWQFLGLAVGWAIFSLLMPCTYPMIPITISYFTKQASIRHARSLPLSLCYGAGIVLSFIVIGVVFGKVIIPFAANGWTNLVISVVFVAFGLSLLGLFLLQPPQFLLGAATAATKQGGYLGVFLMGMTLCVTSFTCTAPFVGNLLAVGANGGEMLRVTIGMGTFGLVMAVPFVFLSLVPARVKSLPKSGEWLHSLKVTLGFIELACAVKFISNCDLVWKWNALPREIVLALWSGILLVAALYVWGVITLKEDVELRGEGNHGIGPGKLVSGLALFLFAVYFLIGAFGARLDKTTEALAPNYSRPFFTSDGGTGLGGARGGTAVARSDAILDDWDAALAKAKAEHKYLAINFTGDV